MPLPHQSSSAKALPILLAVACAVVVVALIWRFKGGEYSGLEVLPAAKYLEKPGNFLGNTYKLRAQIDSQIKWEKGVGRILAVRAEVGGARLPVYVPERVGENLHIGQRYEMRVRIEEGGLVYVESLRKY
jgi:hypothetical protein